MVADSIFKLGTTKISFAYCRIWLYSRGVISSPVYQYSVNCFDLSFVAGRFDGSTPGNMIRYLNQQVSRAMFARKCFIIWFTTNDLTNLSRRRFLAFSHVSIYLFKGAQEASRFGGGTLSCISRVYVSPCRYVRRTESLRPSVTVLKSMQESYIIRIIAPAHPYAAVTSVYELVGWVSSVCPQFLSPTE